MDTHTVYPEATIMPLTNIVCGREQSERDSPVYVKNAHSGTIPAAVMHTHSGCSAHPCKSACRAMLQIINTGIFELSDLRGRCTPKKDTMAKCQKWILVDAMVMLRTL